MSTQDPADRRRPSVETASAPSLANRYGAPKRSLPRRGRLLLAGGAVAVAVAAVAYASWPSAGEEMMTDPVGFTVPDERSTLVDFKLTKAPEATVTCSIQALNEGYAVVGWDYVTVGPQEESVTHHRADLSTVSLATTGSVHTCWVIDAGS